MGTLEGSEICKIRAPIARAGCNDDGTSTGLIAVPAGSTMAAELDRRTVDAANHAREEFGPTRSPAQWRELCAALLADFRSEETAWARLQEKYPRQLRKLDVTR